MKLIKCTPLLRTHCKIKGRLVTQLLVAAGQAGAWSHGDLLHGMAADGGLEGLGTAPPGGFSQGGDTGCWYPARWRCCTLECITRLDTGTRAGSLVALTLRPANRASGATDLCVAWRGCTCGDAALAGSLPLQAPRSLSGHAPRVLPGHAGLSAHAPGGRLPSYACLSGLGAVGRRGRLLGPAWRRTGQALGP